MVTNNMSFIFDVFLGNFIGSIPATNKAISSKTDRVVCYPDQSHEKTCLRNFRAGPTHCTATEDG